MQLQVIQQKIFEIRGTKVMFDFDLAALYEVETKVFNQAVKRNIQRFPEEFMFRLTQEEWMQMRSQFVTASAEDAENKKVNRSQFVTALQSKRNKSVRPYAFTEHGVSMAAGILKSEGYPNEHCYHPSFYRTKKICSSICRSGGTIERIKR